MSRLIYHPGEPPEGTMIKGVAYYIIHNRTLQTALDNQSSTGRGPEPIGYVIEVDDENDDRE